MNNLLRVLSDGQNTLDPELRQVLSSVKEARRQLHSHDTKISDAFYDSLEGLLADLRTVTPDNQDAVPFLKPVSKAEVADYYDYITNPMDFQTMQRKVKQKAYKSKREFQDDLDLIWSNCFTYNALENHPIRLAAKRLKGKAHTLLKNVTDRKERLDPSIPSTLGGKGGAKVNGINGHGVARPRPVAFTKSPSPAKTPSASTQARKSRKDVPFSESPAIVRTAEDMTTFAQLDKELDVGLNNDLSAGEFSGLSLEEKLRAFSVDDSESGGDDGFMAVDSDVGEKRKMNGHVETRPRKRLRETPVEKNVTDLWWHAMQSDTMIGNAIPTLRYSSSEDPSDQSPPHPITDPPRRPGVRTGKKRKKGGPGPEDEKTLLYHMNNNIRTFRRIQNAYGKLAVLKEAIAADEAQQGGDGRATFVPPPPTSNDVGDVVDDEPWRPVGSGLDLGEENANDCLRWMSSKVLQHAGFQGTSKVALDVMVGIAGDYLNSLGHTIQYLCDTYANKMSAEEIILHALFASGTTRINELERYVSDDIVRNGSRLADLEKKLINAYEEATSGEAWDDEALFRGEEEEEEDGEFVMGNFADSFGEDFLGLRELGIADEFGLSSLTIPKKLLRGKNRNGLKGAEASKPTEPPPPFPPPPPFVLLDTAHLDDQIGLLRDFYHRRLESLPTSVISPPTPPTRFAEPTSAFIPAPIPNGLVNGQLVPMSAQIIPPPSLSASVPTIIPDDTAPTAHTKIGPLGQIVKSAPAGGSSKKKGAAKPKATPALGNLPGGDDEQQAETPAATPIGAGPETPRKPKATPKKKKQNGIEILPPVIVASV
ncbi:hypothetical protein BDY19DRAFT_955929 [Irpex rosettiformis]|uniref:Uncharacterized protein n=1 Tax=Irpex rosettiformis TaxID=378272 RepID=A0ACB8TYA4_9APHY|nr:hypothetical protein BDY19DRAFT_955929 [Irpex rosettiformis]